MIENPRNMLKIKFNKIKKTIVFRLNVYSILYLLFIARVACFRIFTS